MTRAEEIEDRESRITEAGRLREAIAELEGHKRTCIEGVQEMRDNLREEERAWESLDDQIAQLESELQAVAP